VMTQFVLSVLTLLTLAGGPGIASAQERAIFEGRPLLKVQVSFGNTDERRLTDNESFEFQVRIVERDGRYFWATRAMKELRRSVSGVYITYHAIDGTGYIRIIDASFRTTPRDLPAD